MEFFCTSSCDFIVATVTVDFPGGGVGTEGVAVRVRRVEVVESMFVSRAAAQLRATAKTHPQCKILLEIGIGNLIFGGFVTVSALLVEPSYFQSLLQASEVDCFRDVRTCGFHTLVAGFRRFVPVLPGIVLSLFLNHCHVESAQPSAIRNGIHVVRITSRKQKEKNVKSVSIAIARVTTHIHRICEVGRAYRCQNTINKIFAYLLLHTM